MVYSVFDDSEMVKTGINESKMNEGSFSNVSLKDSYIHSTSLSGTSFRDTMLSSLSLKQSDISGIYLSSSFKELNGAKLDVAQALDVARIVGVEIVE